MEVECMCDVSRSHCRRPRRLGGGKGGEGREPREPKDPNKRMKAGLPLTAVPGALADRCNYLDILLDIYLHLF